MTDKQLVYLGIGIGLLSLLINVKVAMALVQLKTDADTTIANVKGSVGGGVLSFLGLS